MWNHYIDVIMTTMASQITSLTVVYSTVYSDADQRKHRSSASLAFVWGIDWDLWIPRTKGQSRGKCFHLMTSSSVDTLFNSTQLNSKYFYWKYTNTYTDTSTRLKPSWVYLPQFSLVHLQGIIRPSQLTKKVSRTKQENNTSPVASFTH